jgi:hypothetical protein
VAGNTPDGGGESETNESDTAPASVVEPPALDQPSGFLNANCEASAADERRCPSVYAPTDAAGAPVGRPPGDHGLIGTSRHKPSVFVETSDGLGEPLREGTSASVEAKAPVLEVCCDRRRTWPRSAVAGPGRY